MSRFERMQVRGDVSAGNSSATPLTGDGVFTGTSVDTLDYGIIFVNVYADVASATNGLSIQQSSDGTNWDHTDEYSVPAGATKNYAINPCARYLRVVYTNGSGAQSAFRLQTLLKGNAKATSHRVQDDITTEDDGELVKAVICTDSGDGMSLKNLNVQHPLATDGDSVYEKDIDQDNSTSSGFTGGAVIDLFNDMSSTIINSDATNPKVIDIYFKRPVHTSELCMGAVSGSFSNTKITAITGQGTDSVETVLLDESATATDKTWIEPEFAPIRISQLTIEFYTADACSLSFVSIAKTAHTATRMQALKPDGTVTDIDATAGGNLKVSLEEIESGISSNSNSQLNVTPFHADGTEGVLISGVDYESGKSGIDASTEVLTEIPYEHHEIHAGENFEHLDVVDLAINAVRDIRITTPNTTKHGHFTAKIDCESETEIYLYRGVTVVTAGTPMTVHNSDDNSANTPGITLNYIDNTSVANANADTTVAAATVRQHAILGAGRTGGSRSHEREIILKQNTVYNLRFIANAAGFVNYELAWYEHTAKN